MTKSGLNIDQYFDELKNRKIYVAVSGGIDSMVLLHLLLNHNLDISVIHVNYHLRGDESNSDEKFITDYCKQNNIPCEVKNVELKDQLEEGGNLQELARIARYNWFTEITSTNPQALIALGHHSDDQVETFLFNLSRDAGVMGLSAMKWKNGKMIRPLLNFNRIDISAYADSEKLSWRDDSSNASTKYVRNKLRNVFIPFAEAIVPSIKNDILLMISAFQNLQLEIEDLIIPIKKKIVDNSSLSIQVYYSLNSEHKIELLRQLKLPFSLMDELDKLVNSPKGKRILVNHDRYNEIVRDRDEFLFGAKSITRFHELHVERLEKLPESFSKDFICLDEQKTVGQLKIRPWKIGDRIKPIGLDGSKLISDIIKDNKVPLIEKNEIIVLHDDSEIHWCVGLKIGRTALAIESSKQILHCTISTISKSQ